MSAILELRLYEMLPRRMPDMLHQLLVEIPPLFARAGVPAPLGVWECFAGAQTATLVYLLRWESLDQRMAAWGKFYADPQWWKQFEDAHGGEQMLERSHVFVMQPSIAWRDEFALGSGTRQELHIVDLDAEDEDASRDALLRQLRGGQTRGLEVCGVFDLVFAPRLPRCVVLLSGARESGQTPALSDHVAQLHAGRPGSVSLLRRVA
jgi:hypothetical protein